jgi:hypothetical protein
MKPGDLVRINFSTHPLVDRTHQGKVAVLIKPLKLGAWYILLEDGIDTINRLYLEVLQ